MKTTLLIMAAGIGSRFGGGIKQLEPVDNNNHIIMDYSIHDAIEAGFNHVVFIIRRDIEEEFKEVIGERISGICEKHGVTVDYAFQDINDIPGSLPEGRTKPWGTGQAVLAAKNVLHTPFIVINADDYYGKEGFKAVHEYLVKQIGSDCWINQQVTIGYTFAPDPPIIGNGVRVSAGAKVVGNITIGDNAIIAANAAVVKDVRENEVVGGVPAKTIGENVEHKLYFGENEGIRK